MRRRTGMIVCLGLASAVPALTQQLHIDVQLDRLYPSTVMVHEIHVAALGTAPLPQKASDYEVLVNTVVKPDMVMGVRLVKDGQTHQIDSSVIYLLVPNAVFKEGDAVQVKTTATPPRTSNEVKVAAQAPNSSVTLAPNYVQSQALRNGKKRPVGQLGVTIDEMTLTPSWMWARTYLTTGSSISTDSKDSSSNVNLRLGLARSLLKGWYVPFTVETKMVGDQVIDNLSSVSSAGVSSLVPWRWTRGFLRNPILEAPISPDFGLNFQFERRISQDAASRKSFLDKNAPRLFAHSAWTNMRLLKGSGAGDPVELEVAGSGWYLPHQHTGGANGKILVDRLEGLLEVSVLVPVSKIAVSRTGVSTPQHGTKSVVRVKYSHGANEATGFKHSSQLSLGIEVTGGK